MLQARSRMGLTLEYLLSPMAILGTVRREQGSLNGEREGYLDIIPGWRCRGDMSRGYDLGSCQQGTSE
jgi:hypothetical protein